MEDVVYKASHINHPSAIWTRENDSNYTWVYTLWVSLCREYTHRYGRTHETYRKLATVLNKLPQNIPAGEKTEIPQCMPEDAKRDNVVEAYQEYYRKYKSDFAKWTDRSLSPRDMVKELLFGVFGSPTVSNTSPPLATTRRNGALIAEAAR